MLVGSMRLNRLRDVARTPIDCPNSVFLSGERERGPGGATLRCSCWSITRVSARPPPCTVTNTKRATIRARGAGSGPQGGSKILVQVALGRELVRILPADGRPRDPGLQHAHGCGLDEVTADAPVLSAAPRDGPRARPVASDTAAAANLVEERRGRHERPGAVERAAREQPPAAAVTLAEGGR